MKGKVTANLAGFKDWNNFELLGRVISFGCPQVARSRLTENFCPPGWNDHAAGGKCNRKGRNPP